MNKRNKERQWQENSVKDKDEDEVSFDYNKDEVSFDNNKDDVSFNDKDNASFNNKKTSTVDSIGPRLFDDEKTSTADSIGPHFFEEQTQRLRIEQNPRSSSTSIGLSLSFGDKGILLDRSAYSLQTFIWLHLQSK